MIRFVVVGGTVQFYVKYFCEMGFLYHKNKTNQVTGLLIFNTNRIVRYWVIFLVEHIVATQLKELNWLFVKLNFKLMVY